MKAEAIITRAVVIQDEKSQGTVLLGVAEYKDRACNFKAPFEWRTLDYEGFIEDLREAIAKSLDCPASKIHIPKEMLFDRMSFYDQQLHGSLQ